MDDHGTTGAFRPGTKLVTVPVGFVVVSVLCGLLTGRLGWSAISPRTHLHHAQAVLAYLRHPQPQDVVVVGSSRVVGGLDGPILSSELSALRGRGTAAYTLGVPGMRPRMMERLVAQVFAVRPPRELLVLAIETRMFILPDHGAGEPADGDWEGVGSEAGPRWFAWWKDGLESLFLADWVLGEETRERVAFLQAHQGRPHTLEKRRRRDIERTRLHRGKPDEFALGDWAWSGPGSEDWTAFEELLDRLDSLPCEVLFVRLPLQRGFDENSLPEEFARFRAEVLPELERRGFRYEDLNRAPFPRDAASYFSTSHLNRDGCEETSRLLASEVLVPFLDGP